MYMRDLGFGGLGILGIRGFGGFGGLSGALGLLAFWPLGSQEGELRRYR